MCVYLSRQRQRRGAPTATFKSHFTSLRVKRPDTALSGRQGRGRGGEAQGTEGGDAGDRKEATAETSAEEEGA